MLKAPYERYPRYSQRPFPPYRFIQGKNPHPLQDPQGHSYGQPSEDPKILNPDKWYENETYLFGADLYNYAFFWESHESFESLWKRQQKNDPARHLLQGLIMISGAFLKWHAKNQQGLESLYAGGIGHLQEVLDGNTEFMGLNLMDHIAKLSNHFTEVIARPDKWPDPLLHYPFIVLAPTLKNKNRTIVRF